MSSTILGVEVDFHPRHLSTFATMVVLIQRNLILTLPRTAPANSVTAQLVPKSMMLLISQRCEPNSDIEIHFLMQSCQQNSSSYCGVLSFSSNLKLLFLLILTENICPYSFSSFTLCFLFFELNCSYLYSPSLTIWHDSNMYFYFSLYFMSC